MGERDLSPSWGNAETAAVSDELDLDKWIDGSCGLTRRAKIYQRGDLIAEIDRLREKQEIMAKVEKDLGKTERGVSDTGSAGLQQRIDELSQQVVDSALILHVQDRTEERRNRVELEQRKALGIDDNTNVTFAQRDQINIAIIADSVVKLELPNGRVKELPDGMPPRQLKRMSQQLGDSALQPLWNAFNKVISEAPQVSAPLSRPTSSEAGGIT